MMSRGVNSYISNLEILLKKSSRKCFKLSNSQDEFTQKRYIDENKSFSNLRFWISRKLIHFRQSKSISSIFEPTNLLNRNFFSESFIVWGVQSSRCVQPLLLYTIDILTFSRRIRLIYRKRDLSQWFLLAEFEPESITGKA